MAKYNQIYEAIRKIVIQEREKKIHLKSYLRKNQEQEKKRNFTNKSVKMSLPIKLKY